MSTFVVEVIGWTGVLLYVTAYGLVSAGRTTGRSPRYQTLNLVGAVGVATNAFYYGAYPSAVVNVIWFVIAVVTLVGVVLARRGVVRVGREMDPAHPDAGERRRILGLLGLVGGIFALVGLGLAILAILPRPERPLQPVLVFTQDWKPYVARDLPGGGPLSELVRDLLRAANHDAQVMFTDWEDIVSKVETGVGAAGFPLIEGRDRAERLLFTDPILEFEYVLFHRRDLAAPTGETGQAAVLAWLDAAAEGRNWPGEPWRLGTVAGYEIWPELAAVSEVHRDFATPAEAFRALTRGEIHFLAEGRLAGLEALHDPATGIDAALIVPAGLDDPRAASVESLRLVVGTGSDGRALRQRLNGKIAEFRQRGVLEELHARFEALGRTEVVFQAVTEGRRPGAPPTTRLLPAGTRAQVLEWPAAFAGEVDPVPDDDDATAALQARVRVLNGPLHGWELLVAPEALVVTEGADR